MAQSEEHKKKMIWQNVIGLQRGGELIKSSNFEGRTRRRRSRWTWSTSLSIDTSGIHLQTQMCMQNTSWKQTGVPYQWKRIHRTTQNSVGQRNKREKQECYWDWTCPRKVGELKQGPDPHIGATVWVRGETFKAESETADLWQPKWNENQSLPQPQIHQTGTQVPWKVQWLGAGV